MLPGLGQLGASPNWAHFLEGSPAGPKSLPCAFQYESKSRMSAEAALSHPYFQSLGERVHQLDDSKYPRDRGQNKGRGSGCGWGYHRGWTLGVQASGLGHMASPSQFSLGELSLDWRLLQLCGFSRSGSSRYRSKQSGSPEASPALFSCPAASIFSLKEIQLQKDPGYRGLAFQHPGRVTCSPYTLS